jgi:hypothetical protein
MKKHLLIGALSLLLAAPAVAQGRTAASAFNAVQQANLHPAPLWPSWLPSYVVQADWSVRIRGHWDCCSTSLTPPSWPSGFEVDYSYPYQGGFGGGFFLRTTKHALEGAVRSVQRANRDETKHIRLGGRRVVAFRPGGVATYYGLTTGTVAYLFYSHDFGGTPRSAVGHMISSLRPISGLSAPRQRFG